LRASELYKISRVDQKREFINFILSNLKLKAKELVYKLKTLFEAIVDANKSKLWLPLVDVFRTKYYEDILALGYIKSFFGKILHNIELIF